MDELADEELALIAQLPGGPFPVGPTPPSVQRVYDAYREVHRRYVELLEVPECADEALKRALFIQWYSCAEPPWLSGIDDLDTVSQRQVLDELEKRAGRPPSDEELVGMLAWYYLIADYTFGDVRSYPRLHAVAQGLQEALPSVRVPLDRRRGQMSLYWNARSERSVGQQRD